MSTEMKKGIERNEPNDDTASVDIESNEPNDDIASIEKSADDTSEDSSTIESVDDESKSDRDALVRALARQAYHLPGNTWWQDWRQYFRNNHPLLCICFAHSLHPIPWYLKTMHLVSSIVFGLALTNVVWIWFVLDDNMARNQALVRLDLGLDDSENISHLSKYVEQLNEKNQLELTTGMVILWTAGGIVHAFYDNIIWHLTLCSCCMEGRRFQWAAKYKNVGVGLLSLGIIVLLACTTLIAVIRSSMDQEEDEDLLKQKFEQIDWESAGLKSINWNDKEKLYEFLLGFSIEVALSLLLYFFIIGTLMFAGVFGCSGRYSVLGPFLGGRPYELKQLEKQSDEGVEVVLDDDGHEDIQLDSLT